MHRGAASGKFTGQSDLARLASVISLQASSPGGRCQAATVAGRIQSKHQVIVAAVGAAKGSQRGDFGAAQSTLNQQPGNGADLRPTAYGQLRCFHIA